MKSIIQTKKECFFCRTTYGLEDHHIFFGEKNRRWSEKYGLKVWLCPYDHRDYKNGVHGQAGWKRKQLEQTGQRTFEKLYDHQKFIQVFGKNYLDEETEEGLRAEADTDPEPPIRWIE